MDETMTDKDRKLLFAIGNGVFALLEDLKKGDERPPDTDGVVDDCGRDLAVALEEWEGEAVALEALEDE